ncbi:MAG: hypothetical protein ABSC23_13315 [Bryobacteraceae bacterium]
MSSISSARGIFSACRTTLALWHATSFRWVAPDAFEVEMVDYH